jgi:hypothetical protein
MHRQDGTGMAKTPKNWKKNLRLVPKAVTLEIARLEKPNIVVAATRRVTVADLKAGMFAHLGVTWTDDGLQLPKNGVVPPRKSGKYSTRNRDGRQIVRRDLPMVTKEFTAETPNWGDWSNGSHEISWDRDVYQREFDAPRGFRISIELLTEEKGAEPTVVLKFQVDAVLRPGAKGFNDELLYALNVLQENVGVVDVFPSDATREDYLKTVYVAWEILPPGEKDATIAKILSKLRNPSDETKAIIMERYNLLASMRSIAFVVGTSGFEGYFGAKFAEDFVVFENIEYGNAIYVMFEDWETLSKQSRLELLKGDTSKFVRIVHGKGWQAQLKAFISDKRPPKAA